MDERVDKDSVGKRRENKGLGFLLSQSTDWMYETYHNVKATVCVPARHKIFLTRKNESNELKI